MPQQDRSKRAVETRQRECPTVEGPWGPEPAQLAGRDGSSPGVTLGRLKVSDFAQSGPTQGLGSSKVPLHGSPGVTFALIWDTVRDECGQGSPCRPSPPASQCI